MPKSVLRAVPGRMQSTLHTILRAPHGASRLVQAMSAWLVKTRRAPSRHSRDARVYGHMTTAMHKLSTSSPPPPWHPSKPPFWWYPRHGDQLFSAVNSGQHAARRAVCAFLSVGTVYEWSRSLVVPALLLLCLVGAVPVVTFGRCGMPALTTA